ncbi:MAG: replicative DNA helicase [bacterium]
MARTGSRQNYQQEAPSLTPHQVAGRMPPQNIDAEVSTIGALLLDVEAMLKVIDILSAVDFYRPDHAAIYEAMVVLSEKRVPIDLVTVADELARVKKLDQIGGPAKLSSLVSSVASATNVQHYAQIVREKAMLRRLISAAGSISELGFREDEPSSVILDQAEQALFAVTQRFLKQNFIPVRSILADSFERLDALSKQDGTMRGLSTGYKHIDNILGGLQQSDLIILAARPSMGKTAFALQIAQNVAVQQKKSVGIFSLEMSKEQLVDRLISSIGQIDSWKLRNGKLNDEDFRNLNEAYGILAEANLFIDDTPSANIMEVRAKARRLQAEYGLDLIVLDYLQLMEGTAKGNSDNRVQEVSEISRSLKALAREINCPVIALSQLSRAVESRPDKRPLLSDLRESGCLTGDTLIQRADTGERVMIKDLVGQTNVPVWSMDEEYKIVRKTASKVFSSGYKQTYELKFRSGRTIKASANHKFKTYTEWQSLDNLKIGEKLALPRQFPSNLADNTSYSDEQLTFLAHMVGDGCYVSHQPVHYTSNDPANIEAVAYATAILYGIKPRQVAQKSWYHLYLPSPYRNARGKKHPFLKWLESEGLGLARSYEKKLPASLFSCSNSQVALFLHHLWATDGCLSVARDKVSIYYATTSPILAEQVQHLLLRVGMQATLRQVPQVKGAKTFRPSYHVEVQGKANQEIFLAAVGCHGRRGENVSQCKELLAGLKGNPNTDTLDLSIWEQLIIPAKVASGLSWRAVQASMGMSYAGSALFKSGVSRERLGRIAQIVGSRYLGVLADSDLYWDEITSITPLAVEEVFDATVPGTHNFVANDIVVHNSIEQDADVVMFLYRDDYYNKDEQNNLMEVMVRKHRNGPTGDAKLLARLQFGRFETLANQAFPSNE